MSVGPMGMAGSVAGSHLPQVQGVDRERAAGEASDQVRQTESAERAENASGVGQTEEDQEASDRDADGRRPWEAPAEVPPSPQGVDEEADPAPRSKDPTGDRGRHLDLSG